LRWQRRSLDNQAAIPVGRAVGHLDVVVVVAWLVRDQVGSDGGPEDITLPQARTRGCSCYSLGVDCRHRLVLQSRQRHEVGDRHGLQVGELAGKDGVLDWLALVRGTSGLHGAEEPEETHQHT